MNIPIIPNDHTTPITTTIKEIRTTLKDLKNKNKRIEVKSERSWWEKTGNIAVEYECNGNPSGIYKTESDYWFHTLEKKEGEFCSLVFPVPVLKKLVDKYKSTKTKQIGDGGKSKCVLLPLRELFLE